MKILLSLFVACLAVAAQPASNNPLPSGELSIGAYGARSEGTTKWYPALSVGYAHNAFRKPNMPLLFEYNGIYSNDANSTIAIKSSLEYFGGGFRFGGAPVLGGPGGSPFFGSITGGFAKSSSVSAYYVGNTVQTSRATVTKAGLSFVGGFNIPATEAWGIRADVRGTKIQDVQTWLYQVGGGVYFRFGK